MQAIDIKYTREFLAGDTVGLSTAAQSGIREKPTLERSRPHGATRSAPIPAPSVAARPPMMRRTIGPVPVARSRPPPSRRARSGSRRPGGGPTRRKHDARPDRPLVTPRSRVVDPLRCSLSRSYANPHGFTRPINYTDTLPASCCPPEFIRPHQARNLIHSESSM
jgi:hypothetical protein